jgi:hypothetical protein
VAYYKEYVKTKRGHLSKYLDHAHRRAKRKEIPFNITLDYLETIAMDECPVFKTLFDWGRGKGSNTKNNFQERPSLDRIIPELGYVEGNVVFISMRANGIKQDATEKELYAVADWLHEARKNVNKITTPSVSTGHDTQSQNNSVIGAVSRTRFGENSNNTDDYLGATRGENAYHSAKKGSGNGVGARDQEVETPIASESEQDYGEPIRPYIWP